MLSIAVRAAAVDWNRRKYLTRYILEDGLAYAQALTNYSGFVARGCRNSFTSASDLYRCEILFFSSLAISAYVWS